MNEIINYDHIYDSMMKCRKTVSWKPSVKHYLLNSVEESLKMEKELENGTWKNGRPKKITITYPKRREGLSIPFRDRVYQRCLNDGALYPQMTRSFINNNCACQLKKGTDFARKEIKKHLWNYYCHFGNHGYVLQIDIHGYYANMSHKLVDDTFSSIEPEIHDRCMDVLNAQCSGDIGYNPGSQMVQIAGISVLSKLDHYIKERLRVKHYIRYMDDYWILTDKRDQAEEWLTEIKKQLGKLGFTTSDKKTMITPLNKGFLFLGFNYKMTGTGKIIMTLNSQSTRHERRKLKRMAANVKKGTLDESKMNESVNSWKAFVEHGNSYKLINRMNKFYEEALNAKH